MAESTDESRYDISIKIEIIKYPSGGGEPEPYWKIDQQYSKTLKQPVTGIQKRSAQMGVHLCEDGILSDDSKREKKRR